MASTTSQSDLSIPGLGAISTDTNDSTVNPISVQQDRPDTQNDTPMNEAHPGTDTDASMSVEDQLRDLISPVNEERTIEGNEIVAFSSTILNGGDTVEPSGSMASEHNGLFSIQTSEIIRPQTQTVQSGDVPMEGHSAPDGTNGETNNAEGELVQDSQNGEAEWEVDSSPYESSSDSSSSDDSSSDDSDEDEEDLDYAMLDPAEQARILMQDAGSDDEGPSKGGKTGGHIRTINEKPEEVIPKPDIVVTPEMVIEELGSVEAAVEGTVLIKGKVSGEYQVLESGSVLCTKDRIVLGVVAETLGRVEQPLYTVRFTNDEAIQEAGLAEKGTPVYYVQQHSTFVFTQPLKGLKGSDASNVNDEEIGDEEREFSDDEAEAEWKRQKKEGRQSRRDAKNGAENATRPKKMNFNGPSMYDDSTEINYDDVETKEDDGYTPLARPSNLHEMMSQPGLASGGKQDHAGRGSGYNRGGRGRGRGGRDRRNDYSSSVNEQRKYQMPRQNGSSAGQHGWQAQNTVANNFPSNQQSNFAPASGSYGQGYQMPQISQPLPIPQPPSLTPQNPQYPSFSPSPISPLPMSQFNWSTMPPPPSPQGPGMSPGSHLNPAFFNQQRPQYGQGSGSGPSTDNSVALAQVQAQLEMLRQYGHNFQQKGNTGR